MDAVAERFWSKVDASGICWEWKAAKARGYGRFGVGSKVVLAHRWAWLNLVGPIGEGLELDHLCRNRACVNPDHMQPVTHTENVRRGYGGWNTASKTHCPQGHLYAGDNLMISSGRRYCRACHRAQGRANYKSKPRAYDTHCPQGHEFTEENTGHRSNGHRYCRACNRKRGNERYAAIRAAG
jgi:hypothetical protein